MRQFCGREAAILGENFTAMPRLLWFFLLCFWIGSASNVWSQCCSPGNPVGGAISPGVNQTGNWQLFTGYRYGYSGAYFEGNKPAESAFIQRGAFQHIMLAATYGISQRLTLELEGGYFLQKTQVYQAGILPSQQTGTGLTDFNVLARVNIFRDEVRGWEISPGMGIKLPIGSYNQVRDGVILPRDLQPSTGSADGLLTLFIQKANLKQKYRAFLLGRLELKGTNPDQYRYGHFGSLGLFGSYSPGARWTLIGQLRGEWRARDTRPSTGTGIPLGNGREQILPTGSRKYFLSPQLTFQPLPRLAISLLVDVPIYQFYFESQLATTTSALLTLRWEIPAKGEG